MAISTGANMPACTDEDLRNAIEEYRAKQGRPTKFSPIIAAEIIERLQHGETLRAICKDAHLPAFTTVYDWIDNVPSFAHGFALARKRSGTSFVYDGVDILDGMASKTGEDGKPITPAMAEVRLAEARANYRMQLAKVFDREGLGDRQQQGTQVGDISLVFNLAGNQLPPAIEVKPVTETDTETAGDGITYEIPGS